MSSTAVEMPQHPAPAPPGYKLFDARAVAIATLFGTPVAGTSLMAVNYSRLGAKGKAALTLVTGLLVTALAVLLTWKLPNSVSVPVAFGLLFATQRAALSLQGAAVKDHVQRGGALGSRWGAFGVGVAFFACLFVAVFIPIYLADNLPGVKFGSQDEVFYSGSATKPEAQALGDALKSSGYFKDAGANVFLDKGRNGTVVSFVVKDGFWDKPDILPSFEEIGREIAPGVGGFPIQLRLVDAQRDVKKQTAIGRVAFPGDDDVYYFGSVTDAEAKALGQSLKSQDYFQEKGVDVFLSKHNDGTTLSFVVSDAAFSDPHLASGFEAVVRQSAPTIGGLPIKLRLLNTQLEVKKEETIQ